MSLPVRLPATQEIPTSTDRSSLSFGTAAMALLTVDTWAEAGIGTESVAGLLPRLSPGAVTVDFFEIENIGADVLGKGVVGIEAEVEGRAAEGSPLVPSVVLFVERS